MNTTLSPNSERQFLEHLYNTSKCSVKCSEFGDKVVFILLGIIVLCNYSQPVTITVIPNHK
jgi:hypothetical protein